VGAKEANGAVLGAWSPEGAREGNLDGPVEVGKSVVGKRVVGSNVGALDGTSTAGPNRIVGDAEGRGKSVGGVDGVEVGLDVGVVEGLDFGVVEGVKVGVEVGAVVGVEVGVEDVNVGAVDTVGVLERDGERVEKSHRKDLCNKPGTSLSSCRL
jgi:hypothetical protein